MKLISHRGNTSGKLENWENEPTYVNMAIQKGYEVEVDIWYKDGIFWLGHDKPEYGIQFRWLRDRAERLWIHCKNVDALAQLHEDNSGYPFNFFFHANDDAVLTSHGYIWVYPGNTLSNQSIAVLPELFPEQDLSKCVGICSDYIENYKI